MNRVGISRVTILIAHLALDAVGASPGLTLTRFDNTALAGDGTASVLGTLEGFPTEVGSAAVAASSFTLTGRLAPPTAGNYGFQLTFDPPLDYPAPDAFARFWVNDNMLWPRSSSNLSASPRTPSTPCAGCIAPLWMPLPPRALDIHGRTVPANGSAPLGSYEVRMEYVCMLPEGCHKRMATIRWATFPEPPADAIDPVPPIPAYKPIPISVLDTASSEPELMRRALYKQLEQGWNTWDHRSSLAWALLPEGFSLRLGLVRYSTGAVLQYSDNLIVNSIKPHSMAYPDPNFVIRLGQHSIDNSFAELTVTWRGDNVTSQTGGVDADAINVSFAVTVDINDNSQLTIMASVNNPSAVNVSDYGVLVCPLFMYGRSGDVSSVVANGKAQITGAGTGLRERSVHVLDGQVSQPSDLSREIQSQLTNYSHYFAISLGHTTFISTNKSETSEIVAAKTSAYRAREAATLDKYGPGWRDVKDAVQTSLMWSVMYDPKLSILVPSYPGVSGLGGDAWSIQIDGGTTEVIFEWDQSFASYMLALDALDISFSNLIATIKERTVGGFVPSISAGSYKTRTSTQPPISGKALHEIVKRWGPNRTKWVVELCFDDLFNWNTWMFTQRREVPAGLLTCGDSPYDTWAPDGSQESSHPGGGWGCSGLDNGPTVEGLPFNQTGLDVQDQYDAGFTGMYLMDCRSQIALAKVLGRDDAAAELQRRFDIVNKAMIETLWNATEGVFQNVLSTPPTPMDHLAPTHFYPLLGGPDNGPSEELVVTTVKKGLTDPTRMAVWPSGTPPEDLPPDGARPLVQWYSKKCDKGYGCPGSPHVVCCQAECNYLYAYGDFVQRTHGKIRYEGMALPRAYPGKELGLPEGMELQPLFEYNCTGGDLTLGPKGWAPSHGGPCELATDYQPAMYVMPTRAGPAADSLVELEIWYKSGDHYIVGSLQGKADAKSSNYSKIGSLGYVWPAPGDPNATSRYALPSLSKDDIYYASQDYWRGRAWSPMIQLVYWGLSEYQSEEAKGATKGLVAQAKALMLKEWQGYDSNNKWAGTGRRVMENYDADTGEGYSYSSSASPMYAWGALAGFIGLVDNGFYNPVP